MINFFKFKFAKSKKTHFSDSYDHHKKPRVSWRKNPLNSKPMRAAAAALVFLFLLGQFNFVHAEIQAEDAFSEGGESGYETLAELCSVEATYKNIIENISSEHSDYKDGVTFWCPDLDSDGVSELIAALCPTNNQSATGIETLFVYDVEIKEGNAEVYEVCEIEDMPIRLGFSMTKDGQAIYSLITSPGTGTVEEGTVKFNSSRTDLVLSSKHTYSLANNEHTKYDSYSVNGYYSESDTNSQYNDWGPLAVETLAMQDFAIGTDNFSFGHNRDEDVSGFTGLYEHEITDDQYYNLTDERSASRIAEIDNYLDSSFGGACFGMSALMGFANRGQITVSNLESSASTVNGLSKPTEDENLFCTLNYLSALQYDVYDEHSVVNVGGFLNFGFSDQLKNLVEQYLSSDAVWQTLNYTTADSGHALLFIGLEHFTDIGVYRATMYDVNSVTDENPSGSYVYMFIKDDFSDFILKDINGLKDKSSVKKLWVTSIGYAFSLADESLIIGNEAGSQTVHENSNTYDSSNAETVDAILSYKSDANLTLEISGQGTLKIEDGIASSDDFEITESVPIVSDGLGEATYDRVSIPAGASYTLTCNGQTDIRLAAGNEYYMIQGNINGSAVLSDNQIDISSASGEFEVGTLSEGKLVKMSGTASSGFSLKKSEDGTLGMSSEQAVDVTNVKLFGNNEKQVYENLGSKTSLELTADGVAGGGSFSLSPVVIAVICVVVAAVIVVVILVIHRRKTHR